MTPASPPVPIWLHCHAGLFGPGADRHEIPPGGVHYARPDASGAGASPTGTLLLCAACWAAERAGQEQEPAAVRQLPLL